MNEVTLIVLVVAGIIAIIALILNRASEGEPLTLFGHANTESLLRVERLMDEHADAVIAERRAGERILDGGGTGIPGPDQ